MGSFAHSTLDVAPSIRSDNHRESSANRTVQVANGKAIPRTIRLQIPHVEEMGASFRRLSAGMFSTMRMAIADMTSRPRLQP